MARRQMLDLRDVAHSLVDIAIDKNITQTQNLSVFSLLTVSLYQIKTTEKDKRCYSNVTGTAKT